MIEKNLLAENQTLRRKLRWVARCLQHELHCKTCREAHCGACINCSTDICLADHWVRDALKEKGEQK